MSNRTLLTWVTGLLLSLAAIAGVWFGVGLATRSCSLSQADRESISKKLNSEILDRIVLTSVDDSASVEGVFRVAPAVGERDFALDQGPQRVCVSGAAQVSTAVGDLNVLLRIYDSSDAANANASSNLPGARMASVTGTDDVSASRVVCQRRSGDECLVVAAQVVAGSVSVLVTSRESNRRGVDQISERIAELVAIELNGPN